MWWRAFRKSPSDEDTSELLLQSKKKLMQLNFEDVVVFPCAAKRHSWTILEGGIVCSLDVNPRV
jgi:hypothetical protein